MKPISLIILASYATLALTSSLRAQPLVSIETVTVGDAGNAADTAIMNDSTTGYGSVGYEFNIGKYEVTIGQYATFLNSVAAVTSNSYIISLWNTKMQTDANIAGISRSGSGTLATPFSYSVIGGDNRPIAFVTWFDAARFANWMNNGATNGASTETGAYTLNGATTGVVFANEGAIWRLPTENEWYKAAYYRGGSTNEGYWQYPTQSDSTPGNTVGAAANQANARTNGVYSVTQSSSYSAAQNYLTDVGAFSASASAYGTYDQGGNLYEWNDAAAGSLRGLRGGSWANFDITNLQSSARRFEDPSNENHVIIGFRVANVPEPSTYALLLMAGAAALWWRRRAGHRSR